jgi:TRAP-type C4-dicarboxylate transport system permease small subunit
VTERPSAARVLLDRVYWLAGVAASLFLVAILVIVVLQILTRYFGIAFPGATDYAGYCMAAASFLALAYTFGAGGHIRVELVVQRLQGPARRAVEAAAYLVGAGLAWYFAWFALRAVRVSRMLGDVSQGQDATPLWIPQLGMAAGTFLFAVALTDCLVHLLLTGRDPTAGAPRAEG